MRHRVFARDMIFLVGGALMGFELNLAMRFAQGGFLQDWAIPLFFTILVVTALAGTWLNQREERQLRRPPWSGRGTPYPGLQAFSEKRAGVFFGREREIGEVAGRLINSGKSVGARFIMLVGASGGGKSSLLRAGLKPRLTETGDWTVLGPVAPGSLPLDALADLLAQGLPSLADAEARTAFASALREAAAMPSGSSSTALSGKVRELRGGPATARLLVIDQFEEVFTLASPGERTAFVDCLVQMLGEDRDLRIVAALRSEFLTESLGGPTARLMRDPYVLPAMDEEGLKAAITKPATQAGIMFDDRVVAEMLRDARGGDGLPLLAYLLRELCPGEPEGLRVTLEAYQAAGGVAAALRRQADTTLRELADRYDAEEVLDTLLCFVTLEGAEPTRRRVAANELTAAQRDVVAEFVEARLLISVDDTVDIAHEAMLRQWEPLRLAISRQEDVLRRRTDIEPHAREWDREGRRDDYLLQGDRLREVQEWLSEPAFGATPLLREFVEVSARQAAALARDTADVVAGHALRLLPVFPELAGALAHAAVSDCAGTPHALYALARTLDAPLRRVRHRGSPMRALDRSVHGDVAVACTDGDVILWAGTGVPRRSGTGGNPQAVAWSLLGDLAVGMADGQVLVWRAGAGEPLRLTGPDRHVAAVAWSPDGRLGCLSLSGITRMWDPDLVDWSDRGPAGVKGQALAWSRGGVLAVGYGDGSIGLDRPGAGWTVVATDGGRVLSLDWSLEDALAIGSTDGLVRVLDTGGVETARLSGHGGRALSVAWSPEGVLASGSDNGEIHVWWKEREQPSVLCGHGGSVWALRWTSPTGLVSAGEDGAVLEWSAEGDDQVLVSREQHRVPCVAWSPNSELAYTSNKHVKVASVDGKALRVLDSGDSEAWGVGWSADGKLAAGSADGTVRVWGADGDAPVKWQAHQAGIWSVAWSVDGRLVTGSNDGTVRVWGSPGGELSACELGDVEVWTVAWSADGRVAVGADDGFVRVWRPGAKGHVALAAGDSPVWIVDWSADGRLAASSGDGVVRVWEPALDGDPAHLEGHGKGAWSVAWSADGRLAVGAGDGTVRVWHPGADERAVDVDAHDDGIWLVAWSPEGKLASSSEDNSVRITSLPVLDADDLVSRYRGRGFRVLTPDERRRYHLPAR